ncbi:unnamed protein product, partial [Scytosiphon promiscuus]
NTSCNLARCLSTRPTKWVHRHNTRARFAWKVNGSSSRAHRSAQRWHGGATCGGHIIHPVFSSGQLKRAPGFRVERGGSGGGQRRCSERGQESPDGPPALWLRVRRRGSLRRISASAARFCY